MASCNFILMFSVPNSKNILLYHDVFDICWTSKSVEV